MLSREEDSDAPVDVKKEQMAAKSAPAKNLALIFVNYLINIINITKTIEILNRIEVDRIN